MTNSIQMPAKKSLSDKIDKLLQQTEEAMKVNYDDALLYAEHALNLTRLLARKDKECYILFHTSRIYYFKGEYKEALECSKEAIQLLSYQKDPIVKYKVYNLRGAIYNGLGEQVKSLNSFLKALKELRVDEGLYEREIANLSINISNIYFQNKDYDQSLQILNETLPIIERFGYQQGLYLCFNTYGNIYTIKKEYDKAEEYFHKSVQINQSLKNPKYFAVTYNNLSLVLEEKGQVEEALEYVKKSLAINKKLNRKSTIIIDYRRIGVIHCKNGKFEEGISYIIKSLKLAEELDNRHEILNAFDDLAKQYAQAELWKNAYQFRTRHTELSNKIFNEDKTKAISEMQARHQVERKEREAELLRDSKEKIKEYADRLEESNQDLERFARVASHDMKEPLRMVKSYLSLIKRKVDKYGDKTLDEFMFYAMDGADRMQKLITEMLHLARVQTRDHQMREIDVNDVLHIVQNNLKETLNENNVQLQVGKLPVIQGNQSLLIQLFQNLISNGIKYNRSETPIIQVKCTETSDAHHLEIIDNGIGIKEEYFDQVFEMLTRLHNREEFEGTGIGLATCKRIVERHNGKIWVTSQEGKGSNFQFFIPKMDNK